MIGRLIRVTRTRDSDEFNVVLLLLIYYKVTYIYMLIIYYAYLH